MVSFVMMPKPWPAPRSPHHRSEFSVAETFMSFPSAVTNRADIMLSIPRPSKPWNRLRPPPIHAPIKPTVLHVPSAESGGQPRLIRCMFSSAAYQHELCFYATPPLRHHREHR